MLSCHRSAMANWLCVVTTTVGLLETLDETKVEVMSPGKVENGETTRCEHYGVGVQIRWLWMWPKKRSSIREESRC